MPDAKSHPRLSVGSRYRLLRWSLVQLRRAARRWHINFDNAVESSAKDVLPLHERKPHFRMPSAESTCPFGGEE